MPVAAIRKTNSKYNLSPALLKAIENRLAAMEAILPDLMSLLVQLQKGDLDIKTKSNDMDLVTIADFESERILTSEIRKKFPEDAILAEETGRSGADSDADFLWVLDPVDGTVNYSHGMPLFAIAIGLMHQKESVAGIVALPALGSIYRAVKTKGATKDRIPLHVSRTSEFSKALIVTGFPYDRHEKIEKLISAFRDILMNARGLRRTGSAALDLCWLAEGIFDVHYEMNLSPWDTCGPCVIAREAGAKITGLDGQDHNPFIKELAASNGLLHDRLLEILHEVWK